ncbi:MAG: adenylosuccinate synthetase [archaeon]|nr:MAG: adenylosuccinate synthetase [archaeon]
MAVVGLQWGDEGKGKVVDYLSEGFEAVARYNGGSNAGHTIVLDGQAYKFHLIPSGALRSKRLLIGAGVALDTVVLAEELHLLSQRGFKPDLVVDPRCSLVTPMEKEFDSFLEGLRAGQPLGTTKMGLGPAYAMRALRLTPRAVDLFSDSFEASHLTTFYERLGISTKGFGPWLESSRELLRPLLGDVAGEVASAGRDKGVLFEGAHGAMLDLLYGTYPFVTSSSTLATYAPVGTGVGAAPPGSVGVVKCYTTRVGEGPFPTEFRGALADSIREKGKEYGVTTGRPRRIGWLDLVAVKYAARLSGVTSIALTKVDVLAGLGELEACTAYRSGGKESSDFFDFLASVDDAEPVYKTLEPIGEGDFKDPSRGPLRALLDLIREEAGVKVSLLSYGEDRSATLNL